jgi:hypothetical protein
MWCVRKMNSRRYENSFQPARERNGAWVQNKNKGFRKALRIARPRVKEVPLGTFF